MSPLTRNNVRIRGIGDRAMVFAHGFGCDQSTWRHITPQFELEFVTVSFDHVGAGGSDLSAYEPRKYYDLWGYADDVVELGKDLQWEDAIFVGHSCSAMIGALASIRAPTMFERLVMIGPSPRYIDDEAYVGGFSRNAIDRTLADLKEDFAAWSARMAPVFMGNADRPELAGELRRNFERTNPAIASDFGRAIFTSDVRAELPKVKVPALIIQCAADPVAPIAVGNYLHRELVHSRLEVLAVEGHFPQLSAPEQVIAAIRRFVSVVPERDFPRLARLQPNDWAQPGAFFRLSMPTLKQLSQSEDRAALEDLLLRRQGELLSHLGRYDMHALALAELFAGRQRLGDAALRYTVRTRGDAILKWMREFSIPKQIIGEFADIQNELWVVLDRHEISAQHSASRSSSVREAHQACARDWYDFENADDDDLYSVIDSIERDIVKVTSLYLRISDLVAPLKRALTQH
jgi:sigma-B regulation protein RsbQ